MQFSSRNLADTLNNLTHDVRTAIIDSKNWNNDNDILKSSLTKRSDISSSGKMQTISDSQARVADYGALDSTFDYDDDEEEEGATDGQQNGTAVVNMNTRFAADRTYMAADRTTIAWVRTAISMIGFGVTIAKTADVLENEGLIKNARAMQVFGALFVGIAWLGLILVVVQNIQMERRLKASGYPREECMPLGLSMAILVLLVGLLGGFVIYNPLHS